MASTILADNGVSSGSAGIKTSADSTGVLALQTTTAGGTATTAVTIGTDQSVTFAGNITLNNGTADGAQLSLSSSGYSDWNIDNYSGNFRWYYNATEYMRLNNSGNLGLGVTPSAWGATAIELKGSAFIGSSNTALTTATNAYYNGSNWIYKTTAAVTAYGQSSGAHYWYTAGSGTAGTSVSLTQAMTLAAGSLALQRPSSGASTDFVFNNEIGAARARIRFGGTNEELAFFQPVSGGETEVARFSSGNLLVGTTSAISKVTVKGGITTQGTSGDATGAVSFYNSSGTKYWDFTTNQGTLFIADADFSHYAYLLQNMTSWGFGSDRRMKKDIVDLDYGLDAVMAMKPKRYTFIASGKEDIGFIAQELKEIVPEAVSGKEIEYLETDTPQERAAKSLGIGKELLIPVLVKAIQEQQTIIQTLTERITALEAK